MISHKVLDAALEAHRKWAATATVEEIRVRLDKANPHVPGWDLPLEQQQYKPRRPRKRAAKAAE